MDARARLQELELRIAVSRDGDVDDAAAVFDGVRRRVRAAARGIDPGRSTPDDFHVTEPRSRETSGPDEFRRNESSGTRCATCVAGCPPSKSNRTAPAPSFEKRLRRA